MLEHVEFIVTLGL